jgi:hypothetical protein
MEEQIQLYESEMQRNEDEKDELKKACDIYESKAREYEITNSKLTEVIKNQLVAMKQLEQANESLNEKVTI